MSLATRAPPATGSDPPSQKSFCTSTTIRALDMDRGYRARASLEERRDDRFAPGHRLRLHGELGAGGRMPLPGRGEGLPTDDLAAADERDEQLPVVAVVARGGADPDHLRLRDPVGRAAAERVLAATD